MNGFGRRARAASRGTRRPNAVRRGWPLRVESGRSARGPRYRSFGMGAPMYRPRAAAALPEACRRVPYIVLRLATLAPGSLRENNEQ
jgi:hypothetical protein